MKIFMFFVCVVTLTLGYGYYEVNKRGDFDLYIPYQFQKEAAIQFQNAKLTFLDSKKQPLAKGVLSDNDVAYLQLIHPKAANCHQSTKSWRDCYQEIALWIPEWANNLSFIKIELQQCAPLETPVEVVVSNSEWLTWWIPLPHVGGQPITHFSTRLEFKESDCEKIN